MKQVILVRADLQLPKGKMSAQVAHAAVDCVLQSDKEKVKEWRKSGMPKIVLKVKDLKELKELNKFAKDAGLVTALITDAGRTTVESGTITCLGIGPDSDEKIDKIVRDLKLM